MVPILGRKRKKAIAIFSRHWKIDRSFPKSGNQGKIL
jgi:hypothetical protein